MSDETFERFRRKLADVVTVAINEGKKLSVLAGVAEPTYCPIGCHPKSTSMQPFPFQGALLFAIRAGDACAFMAGFDGRPIHKVSPYFELGCLYRSRFP